MKSIGIVRKVDDLGRIVLPKELRRTLDIQEKDPLEIFTDGNSVVLRKYQPGCANCEATENLIVVGNVTLCHRCLEKFNRRSLEGA